MVRLLLGLAALVGLMWLAAWLGKATPAQRSRALKLIVLYGVAGALLLLAAFLEQRQQFFQGEALQGTSGELAAGHLAMQLATVMVQCHV